MLHYIHAHFGVIAVKSGPSFGFGLAEDGGAGTLNTGVGAGKRPIAVRASAEVKIVVKAGTLQQTLGIIFCVRRCAVIRARPLEQLWERWRGTDQMESVCGYRFVK
jgi:hypothetical protein